MNDADDRSVSANSDSFADNAIAAYLRRVTESLIAQGEDGYLLRVESRRTWSIDGRITGGTVLVATAQGEIAELALSHERVVAVVPRDALIWAVAKTLLDSVKEDD